MLLINDSLEVQFILEDAEDIAIAIRLPPKYRLSAYSTEDQKSEFVGRVVRLMLQIINDHPEDC